MKTLAIYTLLAVSVILIHGVASLATPDGNGRSGGWKNRPKSAVIEQYIEDATSKKEVSQVREPWDAMRFVKQSSKFITLPNPFRNKDDNVPKIIMPGDILWEPGSTQSAGSVFQWAPLDDVVMGGVSSSVFDNKIGNWVGSVSDSNAGGFIGIRTTPVVSALNMESCTGVEFKLKGGEGRRIKAVIRDSTEFNGVCWTTCFDIPVKAKKNPFLSLFNDENIEDDDIVSIRIPFQTQIPTIFSKTVPNQSFNANNVVAFQLVYSKFEFDGVLNDNFSLGDFNIAIIEMKAY